jgi:hypothetical protein
MEWKTGKRVLRQAEEPARSSPPAVLLAFANDWIEERRHLRSLLEESKAIGNALRPLVEVGLVTLPPIHNATLDDVIGSFRARRHRGRIRIFHFSGHASASALLFEDEAGRPAEVPASGLADYLGKQRGLVLVFLNGCCTEPQVRRLRAAGVKAVIATTRAIDDEAAAAFAEAFYAELAVRPLRDAFDVAASAMHLRHGDDPRTVTRDVGVPGAQPGAPACPWIIDCDPEVESWMLERELASDRRRRRRRRWLPAIAALCVLLTSPVWSAGAKRNACRLPGTRPLCGAVGLVKVATPAEQATWDEVLREPLEDRLVAYLQTYPDGAYARKARQRLRSCTPESADAPAPSGPERKLCW